MGRVLAMHIVDLQDRWILGANLSQDFDLLLLGEEFGVIIESVSNDLTEIPQSLIGNETFVNKPVRVKEVKHNVLSVS